MKTAASANYLQQNFANYELDWQWLQDKLQLDLAHVQLLRDFQATWFEPDPQLLMAALFLVDAVNQGSLCLLLGDKKLNTHAKNSGYSDIQAYLKNLDLNAIKLASQTILVRDHDRLYFQKHHHQEKLLLNDLTALINHSETTRFDQDQVKLHVHEVVNSLPYQLESQQIQALLTALLQPFSIISGGPGTGKTTIVLSLLRVLMRLGVPVKQMALAAPTGRAANRITESIEHGLSAIGSIDDLSTDDVSSLTATTLHRLLGAHPKLNINRYHANNYLPFEVVVVDEVSMVDLSLMNQLIQAIGPGTRLVFLGDQFQLPSVQSGALLADLMPPVTYNELNTSNFLNILAELWPANGMPFVPQATTNEAQLLTDKVTLLQVSKRCQPHIAALSELVRQGEVELFLTQVKQRDQETLNIWSKQATPNGVYWQGHVTDQQNWLNLYQAWFSEHYLHQSRGVTSFVEMLSHLRFQRRLNEPSQQAQLRPVFELIKSIRVLTLTHDGHVGTEYINGLIAGWLKKALQLEGEQPCFHGAVIMIKRNDATLGLFNGDVGLVVEVAPKQFQVFFEAADAFQAYSIHLIPDHTLAFAMTVHKSQGSEFNHVLMPLTEQLENPLLTREIIYTGMTRAKQSVYICGSEAALKRAIKHKTIRNSGLTFWT